MPSRLPIRLGNAGALWWRHPKVTAVTFVNDTFTDPNGTALASHTGETGATWTLHPSYTGVPTITTGRLYATTANAGAYASGVPPSADYTVSCDVVKMNNFSSAGPCARMSTTVNTMYHARYNGNTQAWEIIKFVAGVATTTTQAAVISVGVPYRLALECIGSSIRLLVDGVQVIAITDSAITAAGRAGVRVQSSASTDGIHLDNLMAIG